MSKWSTEFLEHPFQPLWAQLQVELSAIEVDDQTIMTSVQELARLKRVIAFLNALLEKLDPELTPKSIWSNYQNQTEACLQNIRAFVADKNIAGIVRANENADNLLTYLRPYEVLPQATADALGAAARSHMAQVDGYIEAFAKKSTQLLTEIQSNRTSIEELYQAAQQDEERISTYTINLLDGTDDEPSIKSKIDQTYAKADSNSQAINELHKSLLVGTEGNPSAKEKIISLENIISETKNKIIDIHEGIQKRVDALNLFHEKIFGTKEENGDLTGGLARELDARTLQLQKLETDQNQKHTALVAQIENLLPGATSAGLGSAYSTLKASFDNPIKNYTRLFYGALALLVLAALIMTTDKISIYPNTSIEFIKITEWDTILKAILYKSPFVAPVVWLALFSSKRRSQYERLQQEYAHKEAIARSYESYKKQLQQLKIDSEELQKELLAKAIDAIAYNASITLDGKHDDKLPLLQLLEKLSPEEIKKLIK